MNKSELIAQIAEDTGSSKAVAERSLNAIIGEITKAIRKGTVIRITGFGTFYVGKRAARQGRNPRTGATIKIKAVHSPKFRPGKNLREAVGGDTGSTGPRVTK